MELIDSLYIEENWNKFLKFKTDNGSLSRKEIKELEIYIKDKKYLELLNQMQQEDFNLEIPRISEINKNGTSKKRVVFTFKKEINYILKMLAYSLRIYDSLFCDNLYSFRYDIGVKKAIYAAKANIDFENTYSYKIDISNYFNSIDPDIIVCILKEKLPSEEKFIHIVDLMLHNPFALKDGKIIRTQKGVMAGVPISGFLANLYLTEMDQWFSFAEAQYIRYSDDIIVFANDEKTLVTYKNKVLSFLNKYKLEINFSKEKTSFPGEGVEFLGFCFSPYDIDVSEATKKKLKDKLKRKSRALYRWKIKKGATDNRTVRAYIRYLNRKFYDNSLKGEITWCRWYFPVLTTDQSLKVIDDYAVQCIRYLCTGKYGKKNYDLSYGEIKEMGFRSLVNNYWKYKKGTYDIACEK